MIGWEATSANLDAGHFHPSSPKGHALLMRRRGVVVVEHTSAFTTTSHRDILPFPIHTPPPRLPPPQAAVSDITCDSSAQPDRNTTVVFPASFQPIIYTLQGLGATTTT